MGNNIIKILAEYDNFGLLLDMTICFFKISEEDINLENPFENEIKDLQDFLNSLNFKIVGKFKNVWDAWKPLKPRTFIDLHYKIKGLSNSEELELFEYVLNPSNNLKEIVKKSQLVVEKTIRNLNVYGEPIKVFDKEFSFEERIYFLKNILK